MQFSYGSWKKQIKFSKHNSLELDIVFLLLSYISTGDIVRTGNHPPSVAAVYFNSDELFALYVGFELINFLRILL